MRTRRLAPGVRLHLLSTARFTTTWCRVALIRDLGRETTHTAVLAGVLQAATARHPTREALAWRLADLHGASLSVATAKPGDGLLLAASLEWPTARVTRRARAIQAGLGLLREVLTEPKRTPDGGALDPALVTREKQAHGRLLRSLEDDRVRHALRRCLEIGCREEPYGRDAEGRVEELEAVTPRSLAAVHARLIRTAPIEVFLVGDLEMEEAVGWVRSHLLWPEDRTPGRVRTPRIVSVKRARSHPRRVVEDNGGAQTRLALLWRAPLAPTSPRLAAAATLAGVLGGGSFARLFKVLREEDGLCYDATATWHAAKGLLVVETGVDPAQERRALRRVRSLVAEVGRGELEAGARQGFVEAVRSRETALRDDRVGRMSAHQDALLLGRETSLRRFREAVEAVTPRDVRQVGCMLGADTVFVLRPGKGAK